MISQSQNEVTSEFSLSHSQINGKNTSLLVYLLFVLAIWFHRFSLVTFDPVLNMI